MKNFITVAALLLLPWQVSASSAQITSVPYSQTPLTYEYQQFSKPRRSITTFGDISKVKLHLQFYSIEGDTLVIDGNNAKTQEKLLDIQDLVNKTRPFSSIIIRNIPQDKICTLMGGLYELFQQTYAFRKVSELRIRNSYTHEILSVHLPLILRCFERMPTLTIEDDTVDTEDATRIVLYATQHKMKSLSIRSNNIDSNAIDNLKEEFMQNNPNSRVSIFGAPQKGSEGKEEDKPATRQILDGGASNRLAPLSTPSSITDRGA